MLAIAKNMPPITRLDIAVLSIDFIFFSHLTEANIEEIKINLINPKNGEYTFIGNLVNINDKDVQILIDGLTHNFEYENIKKANIRFNKFRQKVKS